VAPRRRLLRLLDLARAPQPAPLLRGRVLGGARLLGVQGRAAARGGPVARRDGDGGRARTPVPRPVPVHALPAARVPRGGARAGAGDPGDRGAARGPRPPVPRLSQRGRAELPRLSRVHDAPETGVLELPGAARGALAGLPVLRDADRARRGRPATAARRAA